MICLLICMYALRRGSWQNLQGRIINQILLWCPCSFHCKKPQMPLPLGNLSVCHVEGFSPQKALLDKHQRQLDSLFCGLHCPRGQQLSIPPTSHFRSPASSPLASSLYLFWPYGLTGCFWKMLKHV